ncbi:P-loop NTPase [Cellulomonas sp. PhB150]|uniref:AAA family ATPase n=1 Tax=Cellulomonas sp. PhB150 TaxID=2485188 RepID=UPI000F486240|nr:P-loop NTPase [Cellulomonas sp. PhB150]ROS31170.1 Flp pilus assembly CpaE family ATPase [Cellulomonas sp. PhB150]
MPLGVLCAVRGVAESLVVQALDANPQLQVTRRCADLTELLAAAEAGLGRVAVASGALEHLDREAVDALRAAGVLLVGLASADAAWSAERLRGAGADDVVPEPDDEAGAAAVVSAVLRALAATPAVREPAAPPPAPRPGARGDVVAVWGPTGAPGRTTVAVNVAAELAATGASVLLADADTYGGSVAQVVGLLDEAPGLAAAVRQAGLGLLDVTTLARLAPVLSPQLRILSGTSRADRWPELSSSALETVWSVARDLARWTVVDVGFCLEQDELLSYDTRAPQRNAATVRTLEAADVVVIVGGGDPVGIQRLVRGLTELTDLGLGATRVVLVNRVRASVAGPRPAEAVAQALARYAGVVDAVLVPEDRAATDTALLEARTLREVAPGSPARRAIAEAAARVASLVASPDLATVVS